MDRNVNIRITGESGDLATATQEASKHLEMLKTHSEHAGHGLHQFSGAARLAGSELGHFVHAFALGPIGIAAIAIREITEAIKEQAREAREAAKENREFERSLREIDREQAGKELTAAGRQKEQLDKMKETLEEKQQEEQGGMYGILQATKKGGSFESSFLHNLFQGGDTEKQNKLDEQLEKVDKRLENVKGKALERFKAPEGQGGAVFGSSGVAGTSFGPSGERALKKIAENTKPESDSNPNSHFE